MVKNHVLQIGVELIRDMVTKQARDRGVIQSMADSGFILSLLFFLFHVLVFEFFIVRKQLLAMSLYLFVGGSGIGNGSSCCCGSSGGRGGRRFEFKFTMSLRFEMVAEGVFVQVGPSI